MKIDKQRLERQERVLDRWIANKAKGTLQAVTGFGKTFVALLAIQKMNARYPDRSVIVIVPTLYLQDKWWEDAAEMGLKNVSVMVVNTAIKIPRMCDLLILDEIHNYGSEEFYKVFDAVTYKFILGLTATIDRTDGRDALIRNHCPVIDTIDINEALAGGYISNFKVFNLGIELDEADRKTYEKITRDFHFNFSQFNHDFHVAMTCLSDPAYRNQYAKMYNKDPKDVTVYAVNFNKNMQNRKKFLYFAPSKLNMVKQVLEEFPTKAITFSESVAFAEQLQKAMPSISVDYHSKMPKGVKERNLSLFDDEASGVRIIHTAKALDEGFDVHGIGLAIISSGTSSTRQDLQRTGRAIRFQEGKLAIIVNIYIKDSQDERWLKARQQKSTNILYVNTIQEIKDVLDGKISDTILQDSGKIPLFRYK